jgi:hypothetical protein
MSEKLSAAFTAFDKSQNPGETRITFNIESVECERVMGKIPIGSELLISIAYRQAPLPDDAETARAIKQLREYANTSRYHGFVGQGLGLDMIADHLSRLSAAKGETWISVKEQKPEIGQVCIVANNGNVLGFSRWGSVDIPIGQWVYVEAPMYAAWIGEQVTHWMPLPPPPATPSGKEKV